MYQSLIKRILDIIVCIIGLPIFILLWIIIGMLIKITDNGPIFYKADRIGKNSEIFKMYKFRSMKVDVPTLINKDGSTFNSKDDPRVTKIGKFLRETSLDETPQILNVLKGDMSIVGPRASLKSALGTFKADELDKMTVRPGITGYTQAYFRNGISTREKRLKDAWYSKNVNFLLDFKILLKTIFTVLKKESLYANSNESIFEFENSKRKDNI